MHLTALWQWPPLAALHSPIPVPDRRPPEDDSLGHSTVDFADTTPAFLFLEGRSSDLRSASCPSARND
jgi:hypothetical protein